MRKEGNLPLKFRYQTTMDHKFDSASWKATVIAVICLIAAGCQKEETFGETPASKAELAKAAAGWSPEMVEKFRTANARARGGLDDKPTPSAPTGPIKQSKK